MELNQISLSESREPNPPHTNVCLLPVLCDCYLNRTLCLEVGARLLQSKATSPSLLVYLFTLSSRLIFSSSQGKSEREGWRVFASYSSPCSHWLTLTSQYDTDTICLSPPDITTVLPDAGAWALLHYHSLQTQHSLSL